MTTEAFKALEYGIPDKPGVYRYYDVQDKLLYVGKAKSLKKRVGSYFQPDRHESGRIRLMVSKIDRIEFTLVDTELDALLLENALIKKHQPRFNIRLKDDKTYPYIVIKNEPFPRIFPTRRLVRDGSTYFGPYASVLMMRTMLELVKRIYPLRTCSLALTEANIHAGKFRACLEYQIGNCLAPCEGRQSQRAYDESIEAIKDILKGSFHKAQQLLRDEMRQFAEQLAFEKAEEVKKKIMLLENYQAKSAVVNPNITDTDVCTIVRQDELAVVNYLHIQNGAIVRSHNLEIQQQLEESTSDLLTYGLIELRNRFQSQAKTVLLNLEIDSQPEELDIQQPKIGDKKKIVDLSLKNAFYHLNELLQVRQNRQQEQKTEKLMEQMRIDLNLRKQPRHIECFDNSNFHGSYAVSACVVFKNGKPSKKDYRHFNVKTVEGPNDFATMEEAIGRRYRRLLEEKEALPDLLIVDGGKGQLSSAVKALKALNIYDKVPVLGIAKNLEELFYPNDPVPLHLDKKSYSLKIIQQMRDEAHRFGITHHRNKRSKGTIKSALSDIEGIGPKTVASLLRQFKSVAGLHEASLSDIEAAIGKAKASIVQAWIEGQQKADANQPE
ncbi:MAG: excinuclease ABC subunit UvrC [Bacteroidia bacterium]